jgi:hypothetical protein
MKLSRGGGPALVCTVFRVSSEREREREREHEREREKREREREQYKLQW